MQSFDEIKKYSNTVCEQIRWKKARTIIAEEIENHIYDQRDAYILEGLDKNIAVNKAILQMGDAVSVGLELDKIHKPKPQWLMIILTCCLMAIGLLANYFIESSEFSLVNFSIFPYIAAMAVFFGCYFLDFTLLGKYPKTFYCVVVALSFMLLIFGSEINAAIWFQTGVISINLTYLSLIFPLAYSLLIYSLRNKGYMGIILCGIGYLPLSFILLYIPSFMTFIFFTVSALIILCISVGKGWFGINKKIGLSIVLIPTFISIFIIILYLLGNEYFIKRLNIMINPYSDQYGYGYMYSVVREFLNTSQFIGKGTIPLWCKDTVPIQETDYILVLLTHKFGWVSFIAIVGAISAFSFLGLYHNKKQKSVLGYLISLAIMLTFIWQSLSYIIGNLGYGFLSFISLPFISYGRNALILNSALIGFMLSVFRTGDIFKDNIKVHSINHSMFSFEDGKLIINFKG